MSDMEMGLSKEMQLVDDAIKDYVDCGIDSIERVAHHVIDSGGKRIRPAVLFASYNSLDGKEIEKTVPLAAALELIHTGTLIHDDINDRSGLRRGIETAYKKFGTSSALLTGDFLFIKGFDIVRNYNKEIIDAVVDSCIIMAGGEIIQSQRKTDLGLTEEEYLTIIEEKTAISISASAKSGGILAAGASSQVDRLSGYGLKIGIGFQIMDDVLDAVGNESLTGKAVGNDIREGKVTILSIHALKHTDPHHNARLKEILVKSGNTTEEISEAIEIIKKAGSIDYALDLGKKYGEQAKELVVDLPGPEGKEGLMQLADFAVSRSN